jgi:RNA polymerase sigma-70 factor (sigma-E family)
MTRRWDAATEFDDFVRARHGALLRFAYLLTGDSHLAADLVQDALERTGMRWRSLDRQDDPEGYVRRSILNAYLNHRRRRRRERLVADPPECAGPSALPECVGPSAMARDDTLWRLLAELPPQQRAVLVLRFYEDLTEAEVARVLDCAIGTVKSNSSRALAKLRDALRPADAVENTKGGERR